MQCLDDCKEQIIEMVAFYRQESLCSSHPNPSNDLDIFFFCLDVFQIIVDWFLFKV
jgi:hypothetical protein